MRDERNSKLQAELDAKEGQVQTLQKRVWDLGQAADNKCASPGAAVYSRMSASYASCADAFTFYDCDADGLQSIV